MKDPRYDTILKCVRTSLELVLFELIKRPPTESSLTEFIQYAKWIFIHLKFTLNL